MGVVSGRLRSRHGDDSDDNDDGDDGNEGLLARYSSHFGGRALGSDRTSRLHKYMNIHSRYPVD